ncbi:MAG: hypothetical protein N2515_08215 [Deltaproteobacteria bacterium]|nr:hypothetical protein [Deltaproteobacteria bacterium]
MERTEGVVNEKSLAHPSSLGSSTQGIAFTEYVVLLTLVTVGGAVGLYSLGVPLFRMARFAEFIVGLPIP